MTTIPTYSAVFVTGAGRHRRAIVVQKAGSTPAVGYLPDQPADDE